MSTTYRVGGRGVRMTLARWEKLAADRGLVLATITFDEAGWVPTAESGLKSTDAMPGRRTLYDGNSWVHLYNTGKDNWNMFEHFGLNNADGVIEALEHWGYGWLSEHDKGF